MDKTLKITSINTIIQRGTFEVENIMGITILRLLVWSELKLTKKSRELGRV